MEDTETKELDFFEMLDNKFQERIMIFQVYQEFFKTLKHFELEKFIDVEGLRTHFEKLLQEDLH